MGATPLEIAIIRAHEFVAGIAAQAAMEDIVRQIESCKIGASDDTLPTDVRIQAVKQLRGITALIQVIATGRESCGISA
jgi:hypothetical protein